MRHNGGLFAYMGAVVALAANAERKEDMDDRHLRRPPKDTPPRVHAVGQQGRRAPPPLPDELLHLPYLHSVLIMFSNTYREC